MTSAYGRVFQALTSGRPLAPGEAAQLLADLRRETGAELADAAKAALDGKFRRTPNDSGATFRKKQRTYGAAMRIVNAIREFAADSSRSTLPPQRDRRSTT